MVCLVHHSRMREEEPDKILETVADKGYEMRKICSMS